MKKEYLTWQDIDGLVNSLCMSITLKCKQNNTTPKEEYEGIYAIPRGGLIIGVMMSHRLDIPLIDRLQSYYGKKFILVDDIADTGVTLEKLKAEIFNNAVKATLHYHKQSIVVPEFWVAEKKDKWIVYPWELKTSDTIQNYLMEEV